MLPQTGNILTKDFEVIKQPSKTFKLDTVNKKIVGTVDGLEAVKQAAYCILQTERFDWLIYSWNYGVELKELFGNPMGLVKSKLKKRIREALMQDDRIQSVDAFSFKTQGTRLWISFEIHTAMGTIGMEKEVKL